jgi:hypothetical protein
MSAEPLFIAPDAEPREGGSPRHRNPFPLRKAGGKTINPIPQDIEGLQALTREQNVRPQSARRRRFIASLARRIVRLQRPRP